jgi:diguanylate cyclase (GGDEF)-like protein
MIQGHGEQIIPAEIDQLRQEIDRLTHENQTLRATLATAAAQGRAASAQLDEGVEQRQLEAMLRALIEVLSREKADLEIIVQTIMEHGDAVDVQWRQKLQETVWLAEMDGLTQVANRRKFDAYLTQQWQQMSREQLPMAVLLCDIDHFKQYNDCQGHLAGDAVLKRVAQALHQAVPRPLDLLSRYGGEEFAAILPQTDAAGALAVAERMQAAIAALQIAHPASPMSKYLTVSLGIATGTPQSHQAATDLVNSADQMLYLAKQQGRNRIVYHAL